MANDRIDGVDTRVVEMQFDNKQFEKGAGQTLTTLEKLKKSLNFDNAGKGFDTLQKGIAGISFKPLTSQIDGINGAFTTLAGSLKRNFFDQISNEILKMGKQLYQVTAGQIVSGGKRRAMNIAQAKFKMEGMNVAWEDIKDDLDYAVSGTAYGLDAAASIASQLVASGVQVGDSMKKALRGVSGVAAMTSSSYEEIGNVFAAVAGQGKAMAMQLNQLSLRGINAASTIAKYLGVTEAEVRDMASKGQISFEIFSEAMDEAFGEHAKEANKTFTGAASNIKAALSKIGEIFYGPFYDAAIGPLNTIRETISMIKDGLTGAVDGFSTKFGMRTTAERLGQIVHVVGDIANLLLKGIQRGLKRMLKYLQPVNKVMVSWLHNLKEVRSWLKSVVPDETTEDLKKVQNGIEGITEAEKKMAYEAYNGKYGHGEDRVKALGGSYERVQKYLEALIENDFDAAKAEKQLGIAVKKTTKETIEQSELGKKLNKVLDVLKITFQSVAALAIYAGQRLKDVFGRIADDIHKTLNPVKTMSDFMSHSFRKANDAAGTLLYNKDNKTDLENLLISIAAVIRGVTEGIWYAYKGLSQLLALAIHFVDILFNSSVLGTLAGIISFFTESISADHIIKPIQDILNIFDILAKNVALTMRAIGVAFGYVFDTGTTGIIGDITGAILNFVKTLEFTEEDAKNVARIFRGIFSIIKMGIDFVKVLTNAINTLTGHLENDDSLLLRILGTLGDFFYELSGIIREAGVFEKVIGDVVVVLEFLFEEFEKVTHIARSDFLIAPLKALLGFINFVAENGIIAGVKVLIQAVEIIIGGFVTALSKFPVLMSLIKDFFTLIGGVFKAVIKFMVNAGGTVKQVAQALNKFGASYFSMMDKLFENVLPEGYKTPFEKMTDNYSAAKSDFLDVAENVKIISENGKEISQYVAENSDEMQAYAEQAGKAFDTTLDIYNQMIGAPEGTNSDLAIAGNENPLGTMFDVYRNMYGTWNRDSAKFANDTEKNANDITANAAVAEMTMAAGLAYLKTLDEESYNKLAGTYNEQVKNGADPFVAMAQMYVDLYTGMDKNTKSQIDRTQKTALDKGVGYAKKILKFSADNIDTAQTYEEEAYDKIKDANDKSYEKAKTATDEAQKVENKKFDDINEYIEQYEIGPGSVGGMAAGGVAAPAAMMSAAWVEKSKQATAQVANNTAEVSKEEAKQEGFFKTMLNTGLMTFKHFTELAQTGMKGVSNASNNLTKEEMDTTEILSTLNSMNAIFISILSTVSLYKIASGISAFGLGIKAIGGSMSFFKKIVKKYERRIINTLIFERFAAAFKDMTKSLLMLSLAVIAMSYTLQDMGSETDYVMKSLAIVGGLLLAIGAFVWILSNIRNAIGLTAIFGVTVLITVFGVVLAAIWAALDWALDSKRKKVIQKIIDGLGDAITELAVLAGVIFTASLIVGALSFIISKFVVNNSTVADTMTSMAKVMLAIAASAFILGEAAAKIAELKAAGPEVFEAAWKLLLGIGIGMLVVSAALLALVAVVAKARPRKGAAESIDAASKMISKFTMSLFGIMAAIGAIGALIFLAKNVWASDESQYADFLKTMQSIMWFVIGLMVGIMAVSTTLIVLSAVVANNIAIQGAFGAVTMFFGELMMGLLGMVVAIGALAYVLSTVEDVKNTAEALKYVLIAVFGGVVLAVISTVVLVGLAIGQAAATADPMVFNRAAAVLSSVSLMLFSMGVALGALIAAIGVVAALEPDPDAVSFIVFSVTVILVVISIIILLATAAAGADGLNEKFAENMVAISLSIATIFASLAFVLIAIKMMLETIPHISATDWLHITEVTATIGTMMAILGAILIVGTILSKDKLKNAELLLLSLSGSVAMMAAALAIFVWTLGHLPDTKDALDKIGPFMWQFTAITAILSTLIVLVAIFGKDNAKLAESLPKIAVSMGVLLLSVAVGFLAMAGAIKIIAGMDITEDDIKLFDKLALIPSILLAVLGLMATIGSFGSSPWSMAATFASMALLVGAVSFGMWTIMSALDKFLTPEMAENIDKIEGFASVLAICITAILAIATVVAGGGGVTTAGSIITNMLAIAGGIAVIALAIGLLGFALQKLAKAIRLLNGESMAEIEGTTAYDYMDDAMIAASIKSGHYTGEMYGEGVKRGLLDEKGELTAAANELANTVTKEQKTAWGIASPSKVARKLGGYYMEGLRIGIEDEKDSVVSACLDVTDAVSGVFKTVDPVEFTQETVDALNTTIQNGIVEANNGFGDFTFDYSSLFDDAPFEPTIVPVVDSSKVEEAMSDLESSEMENALGFSMDDFDIMSSLDSNQLLSPITSMFGENGDSFIDNMLEKFNEDESLFGKDGIKGKLEGFFGDKNVDSLLAGFKDSFSLGKIEDMLGSDGKINVGIDNVVNKLMGTNSTLADIGEAIQKGDGSIATILGEGISSILGAMGSSLVDQWVNMMDFIGGDTMVENDKVWYEGYGYCTAEELEQKKADRYREQFDPGSAGYFPNIRPTSYGG